MDDLMSLPMKVDPDKETLKDWDPLDDDAFLPLKPLQDTTSLQKLPFDVLKLEYPQGGFEYFPLLLPSKSTTTTTTDGYYYNPIHDLYSTAQFLVQETLSAEESKPFGNAKQGLLRGIIKSCRKRLSLDLTEHLTRFNEWMLDVRKERGHRELEAMGGGKSKRRTPASLALVCHVLEQAYARVVAPEAHTLRQYEGELD
jgi:hypothetical protein